MGSFSPANVTDPAIIAAAHFAVAARSSASEPMTLINIVNAEQQVVAGTNYRLHLKLQVHGQAKMAEAMVWDQAWRKPERYQLSHWQWR